MKSPVTAAIGSVAAWVSVTRNVRCSGVCPGVWITSKRTLPTLKVCPSFSSTAPDALAKAYVQSGPPSSDSSSVAPVLAASSRLPERKSAWMCVSVTCVRRNPSSAAARRVLLHVPIRVDDDSVAAVHGANQITGLRQVNVVEAADDHHARDYITNWSYSVTLYDRVGGSGYPRQ